MKSTKYILTSACVFFCFLQLQAQEADSTIRVQPTFGGYMITPGPLIYDGAVFAIDADCFRNSYDRINSLNAGSTYFTFVEIGKHFDSRADAFSYSSGNIDNKGKKILYAGFDDWRLPTPGEWKTIIGTDREGAVVNGRAHSCYTMIAVKGNEFAGRNETIGALLFPDAATIKGRWLKDINSQTATYNFTRDELQVYLNQGCAFVPSGGQYYFDRLHWFYGGVDGLYHTTSSLSDRTISAFRFGTKAPDMTESMKAFHALMVRLIRTENKDQ